MGMMCAMLVGEHVPGVRTTRAYCATRVVLRVFGIGSVCIAVTMALERYLALTRPFLYQKVCTSQKPTGLAPRPQAYYHIPTILWRIGHHFKLNSMYYKLLSIR